MARRLSILALALVATGAFAAGAATMDRSRSIVLFGARWCAPCMAEYGELPALLAAAGGDRLVLAWIDRRIAPPPALAARIGSLDPDAARRLADRIATAGYGLPFSAMLDADGRPCAIRRGPLRPGDLATLRARCEGKATSG